MSEEKKFSRREISLLPARPRFTRSIFTRNRNRFHESERTRHSALVRSPESLLRAQFEEEGKEEKRKRRKDIGNDTRYVGEPRDVSCDTGEGRACSRCAVCCTRCNRLHAPRCESCTSHVRERVRTCVRVRKQLSRGGAHERGSGLFYAGKHI